MSNRPYDDLKRENLALSRADQEERPLRCRALPVKLTLNNTHKCNIACPLCFKQFEPGANMSYPDMPAAIYRAVAEELFPTADEISLSVSGEPLVSGNLEEELALAGEYGVKVSITTNGVPLAVPRIRRLVLEHIDLIHLSMDAACKETFERIRAGARWEQVMGALEALLRERAAGKGPRVYANFVMMRENIEELPRWVERMARVGVDGCCAEHVVVPEALSVQSLVKHKALARRLMAEAAKRAAQVGIPLKLPPPYPVEPEEEEAPPMSREEARERTMTGAAGTAEGEGAGAGRTPSPEEIRAWNSRILPGPPVPCPYLWRELWVFHDGGVTCCDTPTYPERMGRVPEDSLKEVWNGEKFVELRRRVKSGEVLAACRHCHVASQIDRPEDPGAFIKGS